MSKIKKNNKINNNSNFIIEQKEIQYINLYRGIAALLLFLCGFSWINPQITNIFFTISFPMLFASYGADRCEIFSYINTKKKESKKNAKVSNGKYEDDLVKKIGKEFITPYLWLSVMYILIMIISSVFGWQSYSFDRALWDMVESIILFGKSILWFFITAYLSNLLYMLMRKYFDWGKVIIILAVASICYHLVIQNIEIVNQEENLLLFFAGRLFMVVWRSVIAAFFIGGGEGTQLLINKKQIGLNIRVISGFVMTFIGCVVAYLGNNNNFELLCFDKPILFYVGAILSSGGILIICEWINQFTIFEFIGKSYYIFLVSSVSYGLMSIGKNVDDKLLFIFDNKFISHTSSMVIVFSLEIALVFVAYRFLYFMIGLSKAENPFAIFKRKNEEE